MSTWVVTFPFSVPGEGGRDHCAILCRVVALRWSANESSTSIWLAQDWASILSAQSTEDLERIDSLEALRPDTTELLREVGRHLSRLRCSS